MKQLGVDVLRVQDVEVKIKVVNDLQKKLGFLEQSVNQMRSSVAETKEAHTFLERTMPLLTHFQICEGLHSISIDEETQGSLKVFA